MTQIGVSLSLQFRQAISAVHFVQARYLERVTTLQDTLRRTLHNPTSSTPVVHVCATGRVATRVEIFSTGKLPSPIWNRSLTSNPCYQIFSGCASVASRPAGLWPGTVHVPGITSEQLLRPPPPLLPSLPSRPPLLCLLLSPPLQQHQTC